MRKHGMPSFKSHNVLISSSLAAKEPVTKWELPSVDELRRRVAKKNDGSMPREPWQRLTQVRFEKWLKERSS